MPVLFGSGRSLDQPPVPDFLQHILGVYARLGWPARIGFAVGLPLLTFALGMWIVVRVPSDIFTRHMEPSASRGRPLGWPLRILRNLLAVVCLVMGVFMALPLVPGPGIFFILLGLGLGDFPGKRRLELWLLHLPHVFASVNRLRARFGRPPLIDPPT